jgi:Zn-dependent protease with chaperone function
MKTAAGFYFDGVTSARHSVTVEAAPEGLHIRGTDGASIATWAYADLRAMSAPDDLLRLGRADDPSLARVEIRDPAVIALIDDYADGFDRSGRTERRNRARIVAWSLAAAASLVLIGIVGVPVLADRIAALIPLSVEHRLGTAIDGQVRTMLDNKKSDKPFECDDGAGKPGRAALDTLIGRLERAANLPIPLRAAVIRRSEANAVALPGGRIYVFEGLIDRARSPDELAGVLAHEIGHVAHRDGTRSLLHAAGLSFLFGMLLGDFTGGGLVVIAAQTVVKSAYSREVEASADLYSVRLMTAAGGDPRALGAILSRIATSNGSRYLSDHPDTQDRVAAIDAAAAATPVAATPGPLLAPPEWTAFKRICG